MARMTPSVMSSSRSMNAVSLSAAAPPLWPPERWATFVFPCPPEKESFCSGGDSHAATAAQVYGVPLEQVTKQMRSSSKAINFGIVYGMSAFSLSQDLHISVGEAKAYMDKYFANFSGVQQYQKKVNRIHHGFYRSMCLLRRAERMQPDKKQLP